GRAPDWAPPARAKEVALGEANGAAGGVDGQVAAADAEDAGGPLDHHHVRDDLGLVGAGLRVDVDGLEEPQVDEPLPRTLLGLQGIELALVQRQLAAQDLVLAPDVAADIDTLDVDLG